MLVTRLYVSCNDRCTIGIGISGGILGFLSGRMSKESHGNQSDTTVTAKVADAIQCSVHLLLSDKVASIRLHCTHHGRVLIQARGPAQQCKAGI